ncbi:MAG: hypothetical protein LBQ14_01220 [Treponema sp.]|jgi:hypothetical protein|nr:hypothetical protein [Treponema sp.]
MVSSGIFQRLLLLAFLFLPLTAYAEPEEERERRNELIRILSEEHIPFEIRPLLANYGEFGPSVQVSMTPRETGSSFAENPGLLVLGIPLSPRISAPGPALPFAAEAGLAFIRRARLQSGRMFPAAVRVVFLGGEGRKLSGLSGWDHPGLRDAVSQLDNPENAVLLYLDTGNPPAGIRIHHGSGGTMAPLHTVRPLFDLDIPLQFAVRNNALYKLFLVKGPPVLEISREAGLSGLYLEGLGASAVPYPSIRSPDGTAGPPITAETMGEELFKYASSLDFSRVSADTHYSFVNLPGRVLFLSEFAAAALFFFTAALSLLALLIYSALARPMLALQWRFFFRRSWLLLFVFVLIFGAFYGAALIFSLILKGFAVPPSRVYYGGAALQGCTVLLCFLLISRLCSRISIPRKARFYGSAAVVLVVLGICAAAVLDITFIPVFLWAFFWALLASLFKAPVPVFLCALALPVQAAGGIKNIIDTGSREMADLILERNIPFMLNMTLIAMPVFMICKRGSALVRGKRPALRLFKPPPKLWKRRFVYGAVCGALLGLSLLSLAVYGAGLAHNPPAKPPQRILEDGLNLTMNERTLLERRILNIRIETPGGPDRIDLYLDTETVMPVIYDAPVPFVYGGEGRTVRFILGEAPPVPLDIEIVVPLGFSGFLRAEALYDFSESGTGDYTLKMTGALPL